MLTKTNYLQIAAAADDGDVLRCLRNDVTGDPTLFSTEKDEIFEAINKRYAELNAQAEPPGQLPRWQFERGEWRGEPSPRVKGRIERRFNELQREMDVRVKRGCKHLIAVLLTLSLAHVLTLSVFAATTPDAVSSSASGVGSYRAAGGDAGELTALRLAALSMLETGNNDFAIGAAGEVSRWQIRPDVFAKYYFQLPSIRGRYWWTASYRAQAVREAGSNLFTGWHIAWAIATDRYNAFEKRFHRPPTDQEFYVLWARPSWLLGRSPAGRIAGLSSHRHLSKSHWLVMERAQRFANLVNH